MQAAKELSEGLWAVESEDDGQDCESHKQEASQCEGTDLVKDHDIVRMVICPFHTMVGQRRTRTLDCAGC